MPINFAGTVGPEISTPTINNNGANTVMVWWKSSWNDGNWRGIFSIYSDSNNYDDFEVGPDGEIYLEVKVTTAAFNQTATEVVPQTNAWHHFAQVRYDNNTVSGYYNGSAVVGVTKDVSTRSSSFVISVGHWAQIDNNQGLLQHLKTFNRALTQDEIIYEMNRFHPALSGSVDYWPAYDPSLFTTSYLPGNETINNAGGGSNMSYDGTDQAPIPFGDDLIAFLSYYTPAAGGSPATIPAIVYKLIHRTAETG